MCKTIFQMRKAGKSSTIDLHRVSKEKEGGGLLITVNNMI